MSGVPVFEWLTSSGEVTTLVGEGIYGNGIAPQDAPAPRVVWIVVDEVPFNTLSEKPGGDRVAVQVDAWTKTEKGCSILAKAIRDTLEDHGYKTGQPVNGRDPETKLYRIGQTFDFMAHRTPAA